MRPIYLILFAAFLLTTFLHCRQAGEEETVSEGFRNLAPEVKYVGMETCRSCHMDIHASFVQTGMGQSFDRATRAKSAATFGEHARVYDEALDLYYYPFFQDSQMYVLEFRLEGADTVHQRLEPIDYIVGSGHHTNSHIREENGYLFQVPITYYTQEEKWDLAPGFKDGANLRFSRYLSSECITCHNHLPEPVPGSINKYAAIPTGIECERCHGPGEVHVRAKLAGDVVDTSRFADYTIVNPRRLSRDLQMDICQRCHLQGLAVLEPGKTFYDFRPGMPLADVMQVYLPRYTNSDERFIMASQADRLRMSNCYLQSDMSCITCHNPHHSVRSEDQTPVFNAACQNCHQQPDDLHCTAPEAARAEADNNCVHCHMPPSSSIDIPHVSITDHYISRENIRGMEAAAPPSENGRFLGLQPLTKENPTDQELARAYLDLYEKFVGSDMMLDSAAVYLQKAGGPTGDRFDTWVQYFYLRKDMNSIIGLSVPDRPLAAWTAYRLGEAWFQSGNAEQAEVFFRQAVDVMPLHPEFREKWGITLALTGQTDVAKEQFRIVLEQQEKRPVAHSNLGYLLAVEGNLEEADLHYDRSLALDPDYLQALINKSALLLYREKKQDARAFLERALQIDPENQQVRTLLGKL